MKEIFAVLLCVFGLLFSGPVWAQEEQTSREVYAKALEQMEARLVVLEQEWEKTENECYNAREGWLERQKRLQEIDGLLKRNLSEHESLSKIIRSLQRYSDLQNAATLLQQEQKRLEGVRQDLLKEQRKLEMSFQPQTFRELGQQRMELYQRISELQITISEIKLTSPVAEPEPIIAQFGLDGRTVVRHSNPYLRIPDVTNPSLQNLLDLGKCSLELDPEPK